MYFSSVAANMTTSTASELSCCLPPTQLHTNHSDEVKIYELRVGTAKSITDTRIPIRQMAVSTEGSQYHTCLQTNNNTAGACYYNTSITKQQNSNNISCSLLFNSLSVRATFEQCYTRYREIQHLLQIMTLDRRANL